MLFFFLNYLVFYWGASSRWNPNWRVTKSELLVLPFQPALTSWFQLVVMLKYVVNCFPFILDSVIWKASMHNDLFGDIS